MTKQLITLHDRQWPKGVYYKNYTGITAMLEIMSTESPKALKNFLYSSRENRTSPWSVWGKPKVIGLAIGCCHCLYHYKQVRIFTTKNTISSLFFLIYSPPPVFFSCSHILTTLDTTLSLLAIRPSTVQDWKNLTRYDFYFILEKLSVYKDKARLAYKDDIEKTSGRFFQKLLTVSNY